MTEKEIVAAIDSKRREGKRVFVCGNGGSAANAEHFTNDLFSKGVRAVCLSSNTAIMTMIANDYGYEHVFSRQLEVFSDPDDLLIVISCSGTSGNILQALEMGLESIEFFGGNGTYGEMESEHSALCHRISEDL